MYKVVRVERFIDTVFCDDFKFPTKKEAEAFFEKEKEKSEVVDISLWGIIPYGEDKELKRFVKKKPVVRTKRA